MGNLISPAFDFLNCCVNTCVDNASTIKNDLQIIEKIVSPKRKITINNVNNENQNINISKVDLINDIQINK